MSRLELSPASLELDPPSGGVITVLGVSCVCRVCACLVCRVCVCACCCFPLGLVLGFHSSFAGVRARDFAVSIQSEHDLAVDEYSLYPPQVMFLSPSGKSMPVFLTSETRIQGDARVGTYQL